MPNAVYRKFHLQPVQHKCLSLCGVSNSNSISMKKKLFFSFPLCLLSFVSFVHSLLTRLLGLAENLKPYSLHQPLGNYEMQSPGLGARPGWVPHCSALCSFQIWKISSCFVWTSCYFSRTQKKQLIEEEIVKLITKPVSKIRVGRYATI